MSKSGLPGDIYRVLLVGAGLTSVGAMVYLAGPYLAIGSWRPLENPIVREIVILLLVAAFASVAGFHLWLRRKNSRALAQGIAKGDTAVDDSAELASRMKDAVATLKRSGSGKGDFLYDLPWYVMIGPPGSGKTTALVNSGLKFPLSAGARPSAIAGVGGTRYCDWWFTEDAVLIDTAGRYTTQDSDQKVDKQSWFAFLELLKKNRPRQPINGVLVAVSLHDLLTLSAEELALHAQAIRARLLELHERLKIEFPVYALFTKADLVAGFTEYFGHLNEAGRQQVWGATFQTRDKTRNLVGEVPADFDALVERLNLELADRLQEEPAPGTRVALYGFPAQMAALKRPLFDFLNAIFEPTRYHANATLRGFYFTSGTQQGTPIDRLIDALVKNFGAQQVVAAAYSGLGKSYFLTNLIQKVIIGEASWVSLDLAAVRRARLLKAAALTGIVAATSALGGALWLSYARNHALVAAVDDAAKEYSQAAGPLTKEEVVDDRDFLKVLPALEKLKYLPTGYNERDTSVPITSTFGLSQFERLSSATETAYAWGLERLFRPRLLYRLEEVLDARRDDPGYVYEALKVYLMLGTARPVDRDLVLSWERQDWATLAPGPAQEQGRKALEEHLLALLDNKRTPLVQASATVVEDSQKTLAQLSVAQRAYQLLKSETRSLNLADWVAAQAGGPEFDRVFEAAGGADVETIRVPGFFTYSGFQRAFMNRLPGITDRIKKESWVLGSIAEQSTVVEQYARLPNDLLDLYSKDFVAAWRSALSKLQLKRLTADKPRYTTLAAIASANSPLKAIFESVRSETALTRERPGSKKDASATGDADSHPNLIFDQGIDPGAKIESQFRPFYDWVEGDNTRRPMDDLLALLNEIRNNLITSVSVPAQAPAANAQLAPEVQRFRADANRLPDPFRDMMVRAAGMFEGDANSSALNLLTQALVEKVAGPCQQRVNGRYPFVRAAASEISLQDFGRLFAPAPNGIIDSFFQSMLAQYADTSKREWTWRSDQPLSRNLSATTLRQFQDAAQIRDAFFSTGGTMPSIALQVIPPILSGTGVSAKFEVNGASVTTQAGTSVTPQVLNWPGIAAGGRTAVTLAYDQPGAQPTVLEKTGAWSLFRILDLGGATPRGNQVVANFILASRDLQYQFAVGSTINPFTLPALRTFRCPSGI
jgi:type VI secretion system protein ImpL